MQSTVRERCAVALCKHWMGVFAIGLVMSPSLAAGADFTRDIKLAKGQAKIAFTASAPEGKPTGPAKNPRLGIAPSASSSFTSYLAKQLDDRGKVEVLAPSTLQGALPTSFMLDAATRSELRSTVENGCKAARLDYLLLMGTPQQSSKTDMSTFIIGVGRMRMRNTQESRLYDRRTHAIVWQQSVLFETSQGAFSSVFTGNTVGSLFGGPEAENAMAAVYADKLTVDLGW